jgi:hypothetical protein
MTHDYRKLADAILTVVASGSGRLITGKDEVTRLYKVQTGESFVVPPELMVFMIMAGDLTDNKEEATII